MVCWFDSLIELRNTSVVLITDRIFDGRYGVNPEPDALEARTRDLIRRAIAEDGPLTTAALASRLGLTPAAVRRHIDLLAGQGVINELEPVDAGASGRTRGRPARAYILSEAGHAGMESGYADVATSVLHFLEDHAGVEAVGEFAREHAAQLEARYATQLATAGDDESVRAQALATALSADGFAASIQPVGAGSPLAGVQLRQGHCPVHDIASQFPAFCKAEAEAFSRLLGVDVQRLSTLVQGGHACMTFIPINAVPEKDSHE